MDPKVSFVQKLEEAPIQKENYYISQKKKKKNYYIHVLHIYWPLTFLKFICTSFFFGTYMYKCTTYVPLLLQNNLICTTYIVHTRTIS